MVLFGKNFFLQRLPGGKIAPSSYISHRAYLMDKQQLAEHGFQIFHADSLRGTIESAASSPKVAAVVATGTASMGAMAKLELLQSAIGTASLFIGFMTGCVVLVIQSIKLIRVWRHWTPNQPDAKE